VTSNPRSVLVESIARGADAGGEGRAAFLGVLGRPPTAAEKALWIPDLSAKTRERRRTSADAAQHARIHVHPVERDFDDGRPFAPPVSSREPRCPCWAVGQPSLLDSLAAAQEKQGGPAPLQPATAKNVIYLFMSGGAALDTFDLKPGAAH
jgi:hypothetical protein